MKPQEVKEHYQEKREEIEDRLESFQKLKNSSDYRWFLELAFVILSSQTQGKKAWEAADKLDKLNLLMEGDESDIAEVLAEYGVSYEKNKAEYLVDNREELSQPTLSNPTRELRIKDRLNLENPEKAREWLVENMKGVGMKGASHFLRNIGYGSDFAILSGHIMTQLSDLGYTEDVKPPSSTEEYLETEEKVRTLAEDLEIPLEALDLVLWSMETREVFK